MNNPGWTPPPAPPAEAFQQGGEGVLQRLRCVLLRERQAAVAPDDHGLGRSRGGLTTKLHLAVEQRQKPMTIVVTAGHRGESPQFEVVLEGVRVRRPGMGRPRTRPRRGRADKAYTSAKNRAHPRRCGIRCTIPDKADQAANRKERDSRHYTAAVLVAAINEWL